MRKYLQYITHKKSRLTLGMLVVITLLYNAVSVASSDVMRSITDAVQNNRLDELGACAVWAGLVVLFTVLFEYSSGILGVYYNNSMEQQLQERVLRKSVAINKLTFDKTDQGVYTNIIMSNVRNGVASGTSMVLEYTNAIGMLGIGAVYMLVLSPLIGGCIIAFNVLFRVLSRAYNDAISKKVKQLIAMTEKSNGLFFSILRNELVLRLWQKTGLFQDKFRSMESSIADAEHKEFGLENSYDELMWFTKKLAEILIIYGIGGAQVMKGAVPFSVLVPFLFVSDVFAKGMNQFINAKMDMVETNEHLAKVEDYLEQESTGESADAQVIPAAAVKMEGSCPDIHFSHVTFDYGNKKPVLSDVTLDIPRGTKVFVRGENGQGKSTLLKLILGLYQPGSGSIDFSYAGDEVHSGVRPGMCVYVPSVPCLLDGTVRQNVVLSEADDGVNMEKFARVMETVGMSSMADSSTDRLSSGEKQRVGIARALYHMSDRPIVVCDEALSNIDIDNRKRIGAALMDAWSDKTVFWVSHDDGEIDVDVVLNVHDGRLQKNDVMRECV